MPKSKSRSYFTWTVKSISGTTIEAEDKTDKAEKMIELVRQVCGPDIVIDIEYDLHSIALKVSPKITPKLRQVAKERAHQRVYSGWEGLFTSALLLFKGMSLSTKTLMEEKLTEVFIDQEREKLVNEYERTMKNIFELAKNKKEHPTP